MDSQIKIYKNVLDKQTYENIYGQITSSDIAWFKVRILDEKNQHQFIHKLYFENNVTSTYFETFIPLYDKLDIKVFSRVKLNCNWKQPKNEQLGGLHYDFLWNENPVENVNVAIFYLNTTNGSTLIEENNKLVEIKCEANSLVVFPNTYKHTGTSHTDEPFRYVLNLNYI